MAAALLALGVVLLARARGWLTPSGQRAAWVLGTVLFGLGGWRWSLPLLVFFLTASRLTVSQPRRGRRGSQVWANGGPALLFLLACSWWGYTAALAAVMADTWASEVGRRYSPHARSLRAGARVPAGTPGALSGPGNLAALVAAGLQGGLAVLLAPQPGPWYAGLAVALAGFLGMLLDALLGTYAQAWYRCTGCGAVVEAGEPHPCAAPRRHLHGLPWVTNQVVNATASLAAGLLVVVWV